MSAFHMIVFQSHGTEKETPSSTIGDGSGSADTLKSSNA